MAEVAIALAARLRSVKQEVLNDITGYRTAIFQSNVTNGFAVWRLYEPLKELILLAVPSATSLSIQSCYAEAAGEDVREDSGGIQLLRVGSTLINWQSAHGSHTNDKKKELSGRAIGLRFTWSNGRFMRRPNVDKLILVLDGTWRHEDLKALLRAGWDEIFFPDEMDKLAKAIV
jgi:hypothetical protein